MRSSSCEGDFDSCWVACEGAVDGRCCWSGCCLVCVEGLAALFQFQHWGILRASVSVIAVITDLIWNRCGSCLRLVPPVIDVTSVGLAKCWIRLATLDVLQMKLPRLPMTSLATLLILWAVIGILYRRVLTVSMVTFLALEAPSSRLYLVTNVCVLLMKFMIRRPGIGGLKLRKLLFVTMKLILGAVVVTLVIRLGCPLGEPCFS